MYAFMRSAMARLAIVLLGCFLVTGAHGDSNVSLSERVKSDVDETKNAISCDKRDPLAQKIFEDVAMNDPSSLSDSDIKEIISLLDLEDDCVNHWVSKAIGVIGERAKAAVPKLRKALTKIECSEATRTAEEPIRRALRKLGVETALPDCSHGLLIENETH